MVRQFRFPQRVDERSRFGKSRKVSKAELAVLGMCSYAFIQALFGNLGFEPEKFINKVGYNIAGIQEDQAFPRAPMLRTPQGIVEIGKAGIPSDWAAVAFDPNYNDTINYRITSGTLPEGLKLTSGGQLVGYTKYPGHYDVTIQATDSTGLTDIGNYSFAVEVPCDGYDVNQAICPDLSKRNFAATAPLLYGATQLIRTAMSLEEKDLLPHNYVQQAIGTTLISFVAPPDITPVIQAPILALNDIGTHQAMLAEAAKQELSEQDGLMHPRLTAQLAVQDTQPETPPEPSHAGFKLMPASFVLEASQN